MRRAIVPLLLMAAVFAADPSVGSAQQTPEASLGEHRTHSPGGAVWRALAIPGWGQVYNRQYIKLPFLYGAIGGLLYLAIDINDEYLLYRRAFLYKSFQELVDSGRLEENPNAGLQPYYDELAGRFGAISSGPIRSRRDNLRRNRDLSIVGIGLVYGLSVLDAFISAHLLDFDVGEDLTLSVAPSMDGMSARMQLRF